MNISDTEWDKISISNFGKDRCKSCPYTRSCQYHKMRSALVYESTIVICNQNMLVSHLMNQQKGKGLFSPSVNTFIIDEAHNIESKFRSAYTTAYSKTDIVNVITDSVKNIRNPYIKELAEEIKIELEELFRMFRVQVQKQESKSEGDVTSFFLEMNKDTTALEKSRDAAKDEINGGNRLAALLCKHYSVSVTPEAYGINPCESFNAPLSATKAPKKDGKGYESIRNISIPSSMKWLKNISSCKPLTDFNYFQQFIT